MSSPAEPHDRADTKPLKIAMIGLRGVPATYGGVERAVEELSAALVTRGHEVTVYARSAYSEAGVRRHRGIGIVRLPQINTKHAEAVSHTAVALLHALLSRRYDVIHLHATGPGAFSPLSRLSGTPTVVTVQGLDYRREKWGRFARGVLRQAARISVAGPTRTLVVSRELQRFFAEEIGANTVYIPNGVQPDDDPGASPLPGLQADRFFLFLGRLVPEKHVHTLISAYRRTDTDVPLVIAGPDSHSPEYLQTLRDLAGDDPRVHLVGPQYGAQKSWLMHNALAFIQPSSIEGLPIALLEALRAGRFPIVSSIPENLEPVTVDDQVLGLTVKVGDDADLAAALERALARTDRREIGERLSEHVRAEYDWANIAEATERVYEEIRGRGRRR
jgi:glycosyltransferase involved in cell wall biosynthesis